jgi:hypothetical protein
MNKQKETGINVKEIKDKHISCSRVIVLKSFQIDPFLSRVEKELASFHSFQVDFNRIRRFKSSKNAFISLQVGKGSDKLLQLTTRFNQILSDFHQDPYWERPKFHSSIAFSSQLDIDFSHLKQLEDQLKCSRVTIDRVHCKIGNRLFHWKLCSGLEY